MNVVAKTAVMRRHKSRVCACLRERRANIVFNGMGATAQVDKERSAIENDFGGKSVYAPRGDQCGGLAARANLRASATGEDRDIRIRVHVGHGS
jgi:hypothetical protein